MTKTINLPQEYFHCPELSKREKQYLIQKAQDSAKALVESARSSHGPVRWIEAGAHKGVQMYKGEGRSPSGATEQIQYVCGATTVQATIEEVAAFMDVSTTPKFKAYVPHQHELLDGVVLYTLVPPGPESQYLHQVTVKWSAAHVPSKLIKNRDFLTLECQDVFTDTTGRRGWVRSYHSVKLPCCPDLQSELGFVRGSFYHTGYVFVESERAGWLDCIHTCQVNLKGSLKLPSAVYFLAMRRRIASVAELGRTLQQRRLGKHAFLSDLELVPKSQRKRCHVCAAKFGMMTRKARCRKCGEVVCGQCTQTWVVRLPKSGAVKKVRVCATCACAGDASGMTTQIVDEISLLSSVSHESSNQTPEYEYHDHDPTHHHPQSQPQYQVPLQLKSTILEDAPHSGDAYGPSTNVAPSPQLGSQRYSRPQAPPPNHPGRRMPLPPSYDPEPYRPIGFVHQSEYDRPRYDTALPPPRGAAPGYPSDYRDSYRDEYARGGYGMPPPPAHGPRHPSEFAHQSYRDEYGYYPPPPPLAAHGHVHGPPPRRYASETIPRSAPLIGKPYTPPRASEETASSSSDSLTAHALERHTRQMGRSGPVSPDAYDHDRPVGPIMGHAPPPQQSHPHQSHQSHHHARATYHGPSHQNDYGHLHHPSSQSGYRDSAYERVPSRHSVLSMHSMHSGPHDHYDHHHGGSLRPSGSDRAYADDVAQLRSSLYSNSRVGSDYDAEAYRPSQQHQQPPLPHQPPQYPPPYPHDQRLSLVAPDPLPLQEQIVPEEEPVPVPTASTVAVNSPTVVAPQDAPSVPSRSTTPDQEAAIALAANATRLMQQQQEIQDQLQARAQALSFSSEQRYIFTDDEGDDDDEDSEQGGVDGLEDWSTTSPATRAMLNEFKSLEIVDTSRPATRDSYQYSLTASSVLDSRLSFSTLDDKSTRRSGITEAEPEAEITGSSTKTYPTTSTTMMSDAELSKLSVVQLYQKILERTKTQHALETDAAATSAEKDAVSHELKVLYRKLNEITNETEVAF